jgi:hypothetical protein
MNLFIATRVKPIMMSFHLRLNRILEANFFDTQALRIQRILIKSSYLGLASPTRRTIHLPSGVTRVFSSELNINRGEFCWLAGTT